MVQEEVGGLGDGERRRLCCIPFEAVHVTCGEKQACRRLPQCDDRSRFKGSGRKLLRPRLKSDARRGDQRAHEGGLELAAIREKEKPHPEGEGKRFKQWLVLWWRWSYDVSAWFTDLVEQLVDFSRYLERFPFNLDLCFNNRVSPLSWLVPSTYEMIRRSSFPSFGSEGGLSN